MLVTGRGDARSLADIHVAFTAFEYLTAHFGEELVDARAVGAERIRAGITFLSNWIIGDFGSCLPRQLAVLVDDLGNLGDHVHAEAIDAAIHPPIHHLVDGLAHLGILPVEVGLLLGILVEEVFTALRIVLPCGAAEIGAPLVRLGARGARLVARPGGTPPVPVGVRVVLVAGGLEPGVLVGRVVDDQVHDDLQAALVRFGEQLVHIGHRAEQRVDVLVVGDVVAVVVLRGFEDRGQP